MLELAGTAIDAISVAGMQTCIQLPGLDLAFDMGVCPQKAVHRSTVLFTHAHVDHMGSVIQHCATRGLLGLKPPTYVVPPENADAFEALLAAWRRLDKSDVACRVLAVGPGGEIPLRKGVIARPFRSIHRVPCQGYVLWQQRRKLKPEYHGLSHDQIREARLGGAEITEETEFPEVAFTGDTRAAVLDREPTLYKVKLLIIEVTHIDGRFSVAQAQDQGHVHLDEIVERADRFENEAILFTHLSARYDPAEVEEVLDRRLPPELRKRVTLLHRPTEPD